LKKKQIIFSGSRPQAAPTLLSPGEGQTAENCKLDRGDLRPWKQYKDIEFVADLGAPKTLYLYENGEDDHWIAEDTEYDFARSPVAAEVHNRLYYTGAAEVRVIASDLLSDPFDFDTDYYKLGVPAPTAALTIDSGYATGNNYRAYAYSYVVRLGSSDLEEGAPSAIAAITDYDSGDVTLSGFTEPPSGRQIGKIRIYRTNASTSGVAVFQYVGEFETDGVDFTTETFTDDVAEADLGTDTPQPDTFIPPPDGLKGLTGLLTGAFAGFVGNVVYISEPYLPHAWPYEYPLDAEIVGLGWFGSTGVVLTDSHVYFLLGSPEAMDVMKLDGIYPCVSKRGILTDVGSEGGVAFPSEEGWALASQDGVRNISKPFIDPTSWREDFDPNSTHAYFYEEKIFAFHTTGAYVIDFYNDRFTTLTFHADAAHRAIRTGDFYFIAANEDEGQPSYDHAIYQWEADKNDFFQYTWKSKKFILDWVTSFSCARVLRSAEELATMTALLATNVDNAEANAITIDSGDADDTIGGLDIDFEEIHYDSLLPVLDLDFDTDITFNVYGDGTLIHTETITSDEPFRLPSGVMYKHMEYELIGYVPVTEVVLATSMDEIEI